MKATTTYRLEAGDPIAAAELQSVWASVRRFLPTGYAAGRHSIARLSSNHFTEHDVGRVVEMLLAAIQNGQARGNALTDQAAALARWHLEFGALVLGHQESVYNDFALAVYGLHPRADRRVF